MPVNIKAGQHTVYWGESLLLGGAIHGISYAQNSLDAWKGFATPGTEAKELYRPKGGLTLQVQPTSELAFAGQWFYNWQAIRYPESGSYFAGPDILNFGGDSTIAGANPFAAAFPGSPAMLRLWNKQAIAASRYSGSLGDWGVSARWRPDWLDGALGFFYRNATDIQPQVVAIPGIAPVPVPAATCTAIGGIPLGPTTCLWNPKATTVADLQKYGKAGEYYTAYGDNIHIMGVSLSKNIAGVSVGAELSYRQNMPLSSGSNLIAVPAPFVSQIPGSIVAGDIQGHGTPGARGDTMHGILNAVAVLPKTAFWDTGTLAVEGTWMEWLKVTQNEAVFLGRDSYNGINKVTKDYFGLAVNFTPTWFQVFPGVDLTAPVTWSGGLVGNSAVTFGGSRNSGQWSVGIAADMYQKYNLALKYNGYYGQYATDPVTGAVSTFNGGFAQTSDRGWVSLTFKTTF